MWRRWIYGLLARLRALVRPGRSDHELNDELSFHVAMETQANMALGMSESEAARRARLDLGGVQQLKENLHEQRSVPWFDHLRQDVGYAIRTILRTKVVSLAVIVTFALGIGANTAIFSLINSVLLSPLPVRLAGIESSRSSRCGRTPVRRTLSRRRRTFVTGVSRIMCSTTWPFTPEEKSGSWPTARPRSHPFNS